MFMIRLSCLCLLVSCLLIARVDLGRVDLNEVHKYDVEIKGEVKYPGIYEISAGATLNDLLEQAGVLPEADLSVYNLSMPLYPNSVIVIQKSPQKELISINSATKEQLCTLKGIKDKMAERIIAYRQENNGFKSLEELMEVKGIGEAVFAKLKPYIKL